GNALQAASFKGHQSIIHLLNKHADITRQDNQGRYVLHLAIRGGYQKIISLVLSKVNVPDWNHQDLQGCSALHFAASGGSDQIVQAILQSTVDINLVDTYGWTALHWACRNGSHKLVHMLRESGADPSRKDSNGWTPLDVATFCHNDSLASLFQDNTMQLESRQAGTKPGDRQYYSCSSCYH
ncbi:ankyrin repeat-containing domain protein, partial [Leptodontidium sp. 2 PMI_412]